MLGKVSQREPKGYPINGVNAVDFRCFHYFLCVIRIPVKIAYIILFLLSFYTSLVFPSMKSVKSPLANGDFTNGQWRFRTFFALFFSDSKNPYVFRCYFVLFY